MKLRPYQRRMSDETMACVQRKLPGVVVNAITGAGKTVVAADVTRRLLAAGKRGAFIVHRKELLRQAVKSMRRLGIPYGIVAPGEQLSDATMHIVSIDTGLRRMDVVAPWLASLDYAFCDEGHHSSAPKYVRFFDHLRPDATMVALSATPWRTGGESLGDRFVQAIRGPTWEQLISDGWISPVRVFAPPPVIDGLKGIPIVGGDYNQRQIQRVMDRAEVYAAAVRYYAMYSPGQPALFACAGIIGAQHAAEALRAAGWRAKAVWGDMPDDERERILDNEDGELVTGETQAITFSDLVNEGLDVPCCSAVYWLRPSKSTQFVLQVNGRASRPVYEKGFDPDEATAAERVASMARGRKPRSLIIDLVRNVEEHGMPDEDRPWTLHGGTRGLERVVRPTRKCPACWCVHPTKELNGRLVTRCPACLRAYQVVAAPPAPAKAARIVRPTFGGPFGRRARW